MGKLELAGDVGEATMGETGAQSAGCAVSPGKGKERKGSVKALWAVGGFMCFGLGVLGAVLPIVPTTPFLLAAAFFFARSSDKLNDWFKSTKLYRRVLEGYATKRAMTIKAKLSILVPVTILLAIGFILMANVPIGRAVLAAVWAGHVVYFGFVVKTDKPAAKSDEVVAESEKLPLR